MSISHRLTQWLEAIVIGAVVIGTIAGAVLLSGRYTAAQPIVTPNPIVSSSPTAIPTPITTAVPTDISGTTAPTATQPATATSTPTACPPPSGWQPYTVGSFDTLSSIAQHFGVDPNLLAQANCLSGYAITVGQTIYVPSTTPTATPLPCYPPFNWVIYIVRPGDTLSSIASRYNISLYALVQANCLGTYFIYAGQALRVPPIIFIPTATPTFIPSATPSASPAATDTPTPAPSVTPITPAPTIGSPTPSVTPITPAPTITSTLPAPTITDTPAPTSTSTTTPPSATPTDTATSVPPTDTPTSIPTAVPTITATSVITP